MFPRAVLLLFCLSTVSGFSHDYFFGPGLDNFVVTKKTPTNSHRVYNAEDSNHKQQKHLVEILTEMYLLHGKGKAYCSGSVISDRWILTAAHCFQMILPDQEISHEIKRLDVIIQRTETNRRGHKETIEIARAGRDGITTHPNFVFDEISPKSGYDIAVVQTDTLIAFREDLVPIKLETKSLKPKEVTIGTIAGYGDSDYYTDEKPREGTVDVRVCEDPSGINVLCSFDYISAGGGDSGGPLVSQSGRLLGVTSTSCDKAHLHLICRTTYVDVSKFSDWIHDNTGVN